MNKLIPLLAFSVLLLVPVGAKPALAELDDFISTRDTYISSFLPDLTHGSDVNFVVLANEDPNFARGLVGFDLSSIPAGSTITDVELKLRINVLPAETFPLSVHKVTTSWDESTATWNFPWTSTGGDFQAISSADDAFFGPGFYIFSSTPQLVNDVQSWVNNPSSNNGWLLKHTTEIRSSPLQVVFASDPPNPESILPMLTVTYTPPQAVAGEIIPIDAIALLVSGVQTNLFWIIPAVVIAGAGGFLIWRKNE